MHNYVFVYVIAFPPRLNMNLCAQLSIEHTNETCQCCYGTAAA